MKQKGPSRLIAGGFVTFSLSAVLSYYVTRMLPVLYPEPYTIEEALLFAAIVSLAYVASFFAPRYLSGKRTHPERES